MEIQHVLEIPAPVERVWALTVDVEGWPAFTPTVDRVERLDDGPLRVGSQTLLKQPGQPERTWTVTALEEPRRFAWSTRLFGLTMTGVHELEPTAVGTRNTLRVELTGWLSIPFGLLLGVPVARALAAENNGFLTAAEG